MYVHFSEIPTPDNYEGRPLLRIVRVDAEQGDNLLGEALDHITIVIRPSMLQPGPRRDPGTEYAIFLPTDRFTANDAAYVAEFNGATDQSLEQIARAVLADWKSRFVP